MADNKTEKPTPKRLADARRKGQVAKSSDLTQAALFLASGAVLVFSGPLIMEKLKELLLASFSSKLISSPLDPWQLVERFGDAMLTSLFLVAPLLAALCLVAVAANFAQLGGLVFSTELLSPKFDKLNPVAGLQGIFLQPKSYIELIKNILKFVIVLWIVYSTLTGELRNLILASRLGLLQVAWLTQKFMFAILFKIGGAFVVLGAADFALQKHLFIKGLMMSKEEITREYKEQEGDPHVKGHRMALYAALLQESAAKQVPKATAVVVNPTHIAVALRYEEDSMNAPRLVAKGGTNLAKKMIEIAKKHSVPVVRNIPLARSLYTLELEEEVPEELYETVAEVLNLASRLANDKENR